MTDFSVSLSAKVDTSKIQKQLDRGSYTVKADVDMANFLDSLDRNIEATAKHSRKFSKIITAEFERVNREASKVQVYGANGTLETATKYVETYKTKLGELAERMTVVSQSGKILDMQETKLAEALKNVTTVTEQSSQKINGFDTAITTVTKTMSYTGGVTESIVTKTSKWVDANNKLHTSVETLDGSGKKIAATTETIADNETKVTSNTAKASQAFEEQTRSANKLNLSLTDCLKRYIAFYAAQIPIRAVTTALSESLEVVKDYDKSITEMSKVWNDAYGSMEDTVDRLGQIGSEVARVKGEMVDIATGVVKAGFSDAVDIETISKVAAMLQNTADEALTADEATAILVSQLRAYRMEAENAIEITDILNAVSAQEAITSGGLAKGLQQASSALATYNNDIYETTALITGGTTVLQGKSEQVKSCCLLNIA